MRLHSVHLTNYRCHADLQVEFQPGFNVIVGVNGSGKTSLLKAVCDVVACYFFHYKPEYHELSDMNAVRVEAISISGRLRFNPQFPMTVRAIANVFELDETFDWSVVTTHQSGAYSVEGTVPDLGFRYSPPFTSTLPIILFYRASRQWNQPHPNPVQAATERNSKIDGYASWWDASLDGSALQSWAISKCLERFQTAVETGALFDAIDTDELALVNKAIGQAVDGIKGLKYDLKQKSLLVEWADPTQAQLPTLFENLSDGQRAVICLVADIARRMCLLNPQLDQQVTQQTPGVVLIDELDMHLHPRWQRILTTGLKRAFPAVQFIVASHSPQVLGELKPEEIILLRPEGTSHPQVSYGLSSSQVLEVIMDAPQRAPAVQEKINEVFALLERNALSEAKEKLEALEGLAPGIPELAGAQALLWRKETLGK